MELLQESMNIQANLQSTNALQCLVRLNLDHCTEKNNLIPKCDGSEIER
jgi:hypothetical protein